MKEKFDFIWDTEKRKEEEKKQKEKILNIAKTLNEKRTTRHTVLLVIILILMFIILFFLPIFGIEEFEVNGNNFLSDESIIKESNFKKHTSLLNVLIKDYKLDNKSEYIEGVKVDYKLSSKKLVLTVDEIHPLYHDDKNTYYMDNNNKIIKTDKGFATPYMDRNIKENNMKNIIINELKGLPYDIFLQIKSIRLDSEKDEENVLILEMYDGNDVYIYPEQIVSKMKFYNQIKYILDENNKKAGNIYLFIGDYYEPKG